jgi:hypothetical protein
MSSALFTWRGSICIGGQINYDIAWDSPGYFDQLPSVPAVYSGYSTWCPFCHIPYFAHSPNRCAICGFTSSTEDGDYYGEGSNVDYYSRTFSTIQKFDVSSCDLTFPELASHLKRKPDDYYTLRPRRFEELIADVYRHLGFQVELTQQTHDGGIDIMVLNNGQLQQIVQCKRYAASRKISVATVREILGVAVFARVSRAAIVATTSYSAFAAGFANAVNQQLSYIQIDLLDASALINSIGAYNVSLPPLHLNPILEDLKAAQDSMFTSSEKFRQLVQTTSDLAARSVPSE